MSPARLRTPPDRVGLPARIPVLGLSVVLVMAGLLSSVEAAATQAAPTQAAASLDDAWLGDLLEHPGLRAGDRDAAVSAWIDRLEQHPDHPLAGPTLALMAAVRSDLADPPAWRERVLSLDPSRFEPLPRGRLLRLQGRARADTRVGGDGPDLHPDVLSRGFVRGPLGPLQHPGALRPDPARTAPLDLDGWYETDAGPVRWLSWERPTTGDRLEPEGWVGRSGGYVELALPFEVPAGGPALIEVDLGHGESLRADPVPSAVFGFGQGGFPGWALSGAGLAFPGFGLQLVGDAPRVVDLVGRPTSAVHREPVVLRDGPNLLLLRFPLSARAEPVVRVLAADGAPHPALRPLTSFERPGPRPAGAEPPAVPADAVDVLEAWGDDSPRAAFLRGLLLALDRRPGQGYPLMADAVERDGGPGLTALLACLTDRMSHLPTSWRRSRARELVERGRALDPDHLHLGVAWARLLVTEDKAEDAVALLEDLGAVHDAQPWSRLELANAYAALGMEALRRQALALAVDRAPHLPAALEALVEDARREGRAAEALRLEERALAAGGRSAGWLDGHARSLADQGRVDEALAVWEEAVARDAAPRQRKARVARWLASRGREEQARARLQDLADQDPTWAAVRVDLADLALQRGDPDAEVEHLRAALALDPSDRPLRDRLLERTGEEDSRRWQSAYALDGDELLASYEPRARDESIVRILDEGLVQVFSDGSMETLTHELIQLRDLAATESRGTVRLRGDVLAVATIKPDGTRYEPNRVGGEYVMPNLEPGDVLETITRVVEPAPLSGVLRPGGWFFRSLEEPFLVSRYVVRLPPDSGLRLETRSYDGVHEIEEWNGDTVHVFERRDGERVLPEVGMPPGSWFLPWAEFGMDADAAAARARMGLELLPLAQVTPEVAEQARRTTDGVVGQQARAQALYDFVGAHVEQRTAGPSTAVATLLAREGNPWVLFLALLDSAGIDADLVWSRALSPQGDPEPAPPFADPYRVRRRLLVRVRPDDGPEVFCDLGPRGLPYGWRMGDAIDAPSLALREGAGFTLPTAPPAGRSTRLKVRLAADGSAEVAGEISFLGALGALIKEQLAAVPAAYHRRVVESEAAGLFAGIDLIDAGIAGLSDERPASLTFAGRVPRFLDAQGARTMPFVPLTLSAGLATEGERRLPFLSQDRAVDRIEVEFELEPGLEPLDLPAPVDLSAGGWTYRLAVEQPGPGRLRVEREWLQRPFHVPADGYAELVGFAARVDASERGRLRFGAGS